MNSKEQVKIMLVKSAMTVKQLAALLADKTGRHYTQQSLQHKISASSLRFDEVAEISELLGFEIKIDRK